MGGFADGAFSRGMNLGSNWPGRAPQLYSTSNMALQHNRSTYRQGIMSPAAQPRSNGFASPLRGMKPYDAASNEAQYGICRYPSGIYAPQRGGTPQAYGLYGTNIEVAQSDSEFMRPQKHQYTNYDYSQSMGSTWMVSHADAFSRPDDAAAKVFLDIQTNPVSTKELQELAMNHTGEDSLPHTKYYSLLPDNAHSNTIEKLRRGRIIHADLCDSPNYCATLRDNLIWHGQVNPKGYKLVPCWKKKFPTRGPQITPEALRESLLRPLSPWCGLQKSYVPGFYYKRASILLTMS
jgi:hypothetical protein